MTPLLAPWKNRNLLAAGLLALAAVALVVPSGLGLSAGMMKDTQGFPSDFAAKGCTACHASAGVFTAPDAATQLTFTVTDAEGQQLAGNAYKADEVYTLTFGITGEKAPEMGNHAGFNLAASAGKLSVPAGATDVQVSGDGTQATHTGPGHTSWSVEWTAPAEGAAVFDLFVNDVDGSQAPDAGDEVYRAGYWLTDGHGAQAGAAVHEEKHFGISLQQYWIGLIGLAGMILIMVAGYVYLKFGSPHNTDQKDRKE